MEKGESVQLCSSLMCESEQESAWEEMFNVHHSGTVCGRGKETERETKREGAYTIRKYQIWHIL